MLLHLHTFLVEISTVSLTHLNQTQLTEHIFEHTSEYTLCVETHWTNRLPKKSCSAVKFYFA